MLLSRVRKLEDLVLWDFDPAAIKMLPYYKQLLEWCDYVDKIRPTPPDTVVGTVLCFLFTHLLVKLIPW